MLLIIACTGTQLALFDYYHCSQSTLNTGTLANTLIFPKQLYSKGKTLSLYAKQKAQGKMEVIRQAFNCTISTPHYKNKQFVVSHLISLKLVTFICLLTTALSQNITSSLPYLLYQKGK